MAAKKKPTKKKAARKKRAKKKTSANSSGIPRGQGRKKAKKKSGPPKGNQFWRMRSSHGRNPKFSNPEQLQEACAEYFDWVENTPLEDEKLFAYEGKVSRHTVNKMRAMTIDGLCLFLDISDVTWRSYKENNDLLMVVAWAEKIIKQQKFSGAAAGFLNANIIARDLGLKDASEVSTPPGRPFEMAGHITFMPAKIEDD